MLALALATVGRLRYAIIALAARKERLGPATILVSTPTLLDVLAMIAFGISVFLYGF